MRVPRLIATGSLFLVAAATAACSSGGAPAATGAASKPGTAAPAGAGSGAAAATTKNVDVCAALPAATAARITGRPFTTVKASNTMQVIFTCEYTDATSDLLQISVTVKNGKIGLDGDVSALAAVGHRPTSVSGVGDQAFSEPDPKGNAGSVGASSFASYGALFGDTYIQLGGLTYVNADQGKEIVQQLHSKL